MKNERLSNEGMHHGASSKLFEYAEKLREEMTIAERELWQYLKTRPFGLKFRRQHPIANYILDFYCHSIKLSIEVDGGYHMKEDQRLKDTDRRGFLIEIGITEFRFTNQEILEDSKNSFAKINTLLREGSPFRAGECAGKPESP